MLHVLYRKIITPFAWLVDIKWKWRFFLPFHKNIFIVWSDAVVCVLLYGRMKWSRSNSLNVSKYDHCIFFNSPMTILRLIFFVYRPLTYLRISVMPTLSNSTWNMTLKSLLLSMHGYNINGYSKTASQD